MRIVIINAILYTAETGNIPKVSSIKDTMIYGMCMGFIKAGHEPVLIAAKDYHPKEKEKYPFHIEWMDCALSGIFKPRCLPYLPQLSSYLKSNCDEIDLIITSEVFSICSLIAVMKYSYKTVVWHELAIHNKMFHYIPSKIWYNIFAKLFYKKVLVIPRSERAKSFISSYCKMVSNTVIEHGIDLDEFQIETDKDKYFVVISQLIERKQVNKIIKEFVEFQTEFRDFKLYIIGDGDRRTDLEQLVKEENAEGKVIFMGRMSHKDMIPYLAHASALLIYTKKDNSMVSIMESIAVTTPIMSTTVPDNSTCIIENNLGIIDDYWNKKDLEKMCKYQKEYVEACQNYRDSISNQNCAEQFIKLYRKYIT